MRRLFASGCWRYKRLPRALIKPGALSSPRRRAVLSLAAALLFTLGCQRDDEATRLRATLTDMVQALEEKEPQAFLRHVDTGFNGEEGLDYDGVRRLLAYHFLRNARVRVVLLNSTIDIAGTRARAHLTVTLSGGAGVLPQRLQAYTVDTAWVRRDNAWLLERAHWQRQ